MPTRFRKARRYRGSRNHGWGQVAQHRRTGAKGGSGMAGLHKHKWSYLVKYAPDHFGHNQFRPPNSTVVTRWLNVGDLSSLSTTNGDGVLDLNALGYQKLLGSGSVEKAYSLRVEMASASALEKVKSAGGKVELTGKRSAEEKVEKGSARQQSQDAERKQKTRG